MQTLFQKKNISKSVKKEEEEEEEEEERGSSVADVLVKVLNVTVVAKRELER